MKPFKAVFQIVENNNCQLYDKEEFFTLTEKSVSVPDGKVCCLILVREMTQLLFKLLQEEGKKGGPDLSKEYTCSGCSGIIKIKQISNEDADADHSAIPLLITDEEQRLFDKIVQYPLLKDIPADHLKEFISCFKVVKLRSGSLLIEKGQPIKHLFILLSGNLIVEDEGIRIATLSEGEVCGEMSYFGDNIASTSVRTLEDTEILRISGEDFGKLIQLSGSVHDYMVRILAKRLADANSVRVSDFDFSMHGRVNEMTPAELLQIFHMHQKTGVLSLDLPRGSGSVSFRNGNVVAADYADQNGQNAVFSILAEKEGVYNFANGLSPESMDKKSIGDFMMLLMEGVRRTDEEGGDYDEDEEYYE
jgi:CRP/FNR family cyclic AMP-dependent transcriptional regulator